MDTLKYTLRVRNRGPRTATGVTLIDRLPAGLDVVNDGGCGLSGRRLTCKLGKLGVGESVQVRIDLKAQPRFNFGPTITNNAEVRSNEDDPKPGNNQASHTTNVMFGYPFTTAQTTTECSFTSLLTVPGSDEPLGANVQLNEGAVSATTSGSAFQHQARARRGRNTVEAHLTASGRAGFWRFDFTGTQDFVAGSFRVELGQVVSQDAGSVVLRINGTPGERIRFSFELSQ
jgi:hypothetical protein